MYIHKLIGRVALGVLLSSMACSCDDEKNASTPDEGKKASTSSKRSASSSKAKAPTSKNDDPASDEKVSTGNEAEGEPASDMDAMMTAPPLDGMQIADFLNPLSKPETAATLCDGAADACKKPEGPVGEQPEGILEVQLTNTPDRKEGEPTVAIHPQNPNNLVVMYASFDPKALLSETSYRCYVQYSMDRGKTWTLVQPWPPEGFIESLPDCGESVVRVGPDGTFYAGLNTMLSSPDFIKAFDANFGKNMHAVSSSRDGGRTWSKAVITHKISAIIKARVDQVTGKLYHWVSTDWMFPQSVTVSGDEGLTWTDAIDVPGAQFAVHDGIFAVASYSPGPTLNVSVDDGRSYNKLPITDLGGKPVVGSEAIANQDPSPWVSADTSQSKRFAVMVPRTNTARAQGYTPIFDSYEVYVTENAGETWTGPATLAAPWSTQPWIEFGPGGELGVVWRGLSAVDGRDMIDAYAAMSFDHGRTFSAPVRINAESHPFGDAGPPADDWSSITMDREYAFISWADNRSGTTADAITARVPLSIFKNALPK
jgi:hypothetical protein